IDRLGPGGVEARAVIDRLSPEWEPDVSARRALLLALAEFDQDRLPPHERAALVPRLLELYRDDPDPGIHGATGWLLRQWQQRGGGGGERGRGAGAGTKTAREKEGWGGGGGGGGGGREKGGRGGGPRPVLRGGPGGWGWGSPAAPATRGLRCSGRAAPGWR